LGGGIPILKLQVPVCLSTGLFFYDRTAKVIATYRAYPLARFLCAYYTFYHSLSPYQESDTRQLYDH